MSSARLDLQADQALLTALSLSLRLFRCAHSQTAAISRVVGLRSTKAHASAAQPRTEEDERCVQGMST